MPIPCLCACLYYLPLPACLELLHLRILFLGYWSLRRVIIDYLRGHLDRSFDRAPSLKKYDRVFELVVGPDFRSKVRLSQVLADIAANPIENSTLNRAKQIMQKIYRIIMKLCD